MEKRLDAANVCMSVDKQITDLITKTTIYWVADSKFNTVAGGDKRTRFEVDQGIPITIDQIEPIWRLLFDSFGDKWDKRRQLY